MLMTLFSHPRKMRIRQPRDAAYSEKPCAKEALAHCSHAMGWVASLERWDVVQSLAWHSGVKDPVSLQLWWGHSCGSGMIPGPRISICSMCGPKKSRNVFKVLLTWKSRMFLRCLLFLLFFLWSRWKMVLGLFAAKSSFKHCTNYLLLSRCFWWINGDARLPLRSPQQTSLISCSTFLWIRWILPIDQS